MRILYYDCFSGISGDMNLAALMDLGVDPDYLRGELAKLGLDGEFELIVREERRSGIRGLMADVRLAGEDAGHDHHHEHGHDHPHDHGEPGHHHHHHEHHHHPHRTFADIRALIETSRLADEVKATALAIFRKVAEAEGKVHGRPVDEVHFHEVGAVDSIVDIVGAAICLHHLGVDAVWASSIELGGGFVRCAHGLMPVPAPATAEILRGIPTRRGGADFECCTPTGAAILAATASRFTDTPALRVEKTGYGIGHRESERPNLLRVHLVETEDGEHAVPGRRVAARLLQCNIDDMTGEQLGGIIQLFLDAGAMDAHFTPIIMKKNRPAVQISVLCAVADEERFKTLLFRHTTTFGVKSFALEKTELERCVITRETPLGPVRVKQALWNGGNGEPLKEKPEFEDCRALAEKHGLPLAEVYAQVGWASK